MAVKEKSDIARNTIFILLVLTILISAVSTWVILDTITQVKQQYGGIPSVQKGYINLNVLPSGNQPAAQATVTGGVGFNVIPKS